MTRIQCSTVSRAVTMVLQYNNPINGGKCKKSTFNVHCKNTKTINAKELELVTQVTVLRILLTNDLKWNFHKCT